MGIRDHEDHHSSCKARYSQAEQGKANKETGVRMKAKGRKRIKKRDGESESGTERETERSRVGQKERRRERK